MLLILSLQLESMQVWLVRFNSTQILHEQLVFVSADSIKFIPTEQEDFTGLPFNGHKNTTQIR